MKYNARPSKTSFNQGDEVYYKREGYSEWRGPGKVIGKDGKILIVKHGSYIQRVHLNRCLLKSNQINPHTGENTNADDSSQDPHTGENANQDKNCTNTEKDNTHTEKNINNKEKLFSRTTVHIDDTIDSEFSDNEQPESEQQEKEINMENRVNNIVKKPTRGSKIKYIPKGSDNWISAKIISRGGKANGKYKHWLNIEDNEGLTKGVDWENDVREWAYETDEESDTEEIFVCGKKLETKQFKMAKLKEMAAWNEYGVYSEEEDVGQHALSLRWVCTKKI